MSTATKVGAAMRTFASDVIDGFVKVTHNGFALLGLAVAFVLIALLARPDLRLLGEAQLRDWLQARQEATLGLQSEPDAIDRATASNPKDLPNEQAAVAFWLSKKYRVAPEPLATLVSEAYALGKLHKIDPTLILSIVAIESSFNPFAQSAVGAQGLMQVMTSVHTDKYDSFGGSFAAFDPVSNLRVGVKVLKDCIVRAGSIEEGLRYYVGAANLPNDGGYSAKVLAEHRRLRKAAGLPDPAFPAPVKATEPVLTARQSEPDATGAKTAADKGKQAGEQVAWNTSL